MTVCQWLLWFCGFQIIFKLSRSASPHHGSRVCGYLCVCLSFCLSLMRSCVCVCVCIHSFTSEHCETNQQKQSSNKGVLFSVWVLNLHSLHSVCFSKTLRAWVWRWAVIFTELIYQLWIILKWAAYFGKYERIDFNFIIHNVQFVCYVLQLLEQISLFEYNLNCKGNCFKCVFL